MFKKRLAVFTILLAMQFGPDGAVKAKGDYVVLLHGMHRTRISMKRLEWQLKAAGYEVINKTYPSRFRPIEYLANNHLKDLLDEHITDPDRKVHFVTHSLGGIVVRQFFADNNLPNLGRVVMLAPPNKGSELTDTFRKIPIYPYVMGPAAMQLGTEEAKALAKQREEERRSGKSGSSKGSGGRTTPKKGEATPKRDGSVATKTKNTAKGGNGNAKGGNGNTKGKNEKSDKNEKQSAKKGSSNASATSGAGRTGKAPSRHNRGSGGGRTTEPGSPQHKKRKK